STHHGHQADPYPAQSIPVARAQLVASSTASPRSVGKAIQQLARFPSRKLGLARSSPCLRVPERISVRAALASVRVSSLARRLAGAPRAPPPAPPAASPPAAVPASPDW